MPTFEVIADSNNHPAQRLPNYALEGSTYTGNHGTTDAAGQVSFTLPQGNYRFRTDKDGTKFWSGEANHCTVPGCVSAKITVTIPITITVADTNGDSTEGLPAYTFDGSTYTGYHGTTDAAGQVSLTLPQRNYRFRADKDGTQLWSGVTNHCTIPGCTEAAITVTIPVTVTLESQAGDPYPDLPVYVFDGDSYTGYRHVNHNHRLQL